MAKGRRSKRATGAAIAPADTVPAACKLRSIPVSVDFSAKAGERIELFTHDHVGVVFIAKAEYAGQQLVPAGQAVSRITFDALPGRNTLKLVVVFSASVAGRGELREQCGQDDSQFLRAVAGDEPLQLLRIIGS